MSGAKPLSSIFGPEPSVTIWPSCNGLKHRGADGSILIIWWCSRRECRGIAFPLVKGDQGCFVPWLPLLPELCISFNTSVWIPDSGESAFVENTSSMPMTCMYMFSNHSVLKCALLQFADVYRRSIFKAIEGWLQAQIRITLWPMTADQNYISVPRATTVEYSHFRSSPLRVTIIFRLTHSDILACHFGKHQVRTAKTFLKGTAFSSLWQIAALTSWVASHVSLLCYRHSHVANPFSFQSL